MSGESVVTPLPEGSARHGDVHAFPFRSAAGAWANAAKQRSGAATNPAGTNSNWGLAGTDLGTLVRYGTGTPMYQNRGGIQVHEWRYPWVVTRPAAITVWRDALWVIETVLAWPTNAVGADNGLILGFQDNAANLRRSVAQCWAIENDTAGAIRIAVRGPTGTAFTALAGIVATDLTKVRVELRNATRDVEASIQIFINDSAVAAFSQLGNDANFPAMGASVSSLINFGIGSSSATDYVNHAQWCCWDGPDTKLGM